MMKFSKKVHCKYDSDQPELLGKLIDAYTEFLYSNPEEELYLNLTNRPPKNRHEVTLTWYTYKTKEEVNETLRLVEKECR